MSAPNRLFGALYPYGKRHPALAEEVFVAPGAMVIGWVTVEMRANIWYNAVVRGDVNHIRIGADTNIQDGAVLHVDSGDDVLNIGERVTVGHQAVLHACTLEDECLIGMHATVLNNAVVQRHVLVAAGAVVRPGSVLETGGLYGGIPARRIRDLTAQELAHFPVSARHYVEYAREHSNSLR